MVHSFLTGETLVRNVQLTKATCRLAFYQNLLDTSLILFLFLLTTNYSSIFTIDFLLSTYISYLSYLHHFARKSSSFIITTSFFFGRVTSVFLKKKNRTQLE